MSNSVESNFHTARFSCLRRQRTSLDEPVHKKSNYSRCCEAAVKIAVKIAVVKKCEQWTSALKSMSAFVSVSAQQGRWTTLQWSTSSKRFVQQQSMFLSYLGKSVCSQSCIHGLAWKNKAIGWLDYDQVMVWYGIIIQGREEESHQEKNAGRAAVLGWWWCRWRWWEVPLASVGKWNGKKTERRKAW